MKRGIPTGCWYKSFLENLGDLPKLSLPFLSPEDALWEWNNFFVAAELSINHCWRVQNYNTLVLPVEIPDKADATVHSKSRKVIFYVAGWIISELAANHGLKRKKHKGMRSYATTFAARHSTNEEDVDKDLPISYQKLKMVKEDKLLNSFVRLKVSTT